MVEHPLREQAVVGSNPSQAIPKALKMVPVATLLGAQHYKTSIGFSSPNKYRTTNIATLTQKSPKKSLIITNVCIHRRTVWKIGSHAKYVILLRYRDYYYYDYKNVQCACIVKTKYLISLPKAVLGVGLPVYIHYHSTRIALYIFNISWKNV